MARNPITAILTGSGLSIFDDETGSEKWPNLEVTDVQIGVESEVTSMPLQGTRLAYDSQKITLTQADLTSSKVSRPVTIRISSMISGLMNVIDIAKAVADLESTYSITARSIYSKNMAAVSVDLEFSSEVLSATKAVIGFKQAIKPPSDIHDTSVDEEDDDAYGVSVKANSTSETVAGLLSKVLR